jgi:hypothetical protein
MDAGLVRARQILMDKVNRELEKLRRMAGGEEVEGADLGDIADQIEHSVRALTRAMTVLDESPF